MNVVTFRHTISNGLGTLGTALEKAGAAFHYIDSFHEDISHFDACEPDLLIIMGGECGAYQGELYPFLDDEVRIIERRLARDLPVLGVCLGAQLMAKALGAPVYIGPQGQERGWFPLSVTEEGMKTPVRHLDQQHTHMLGWHGDTFDLPDGAALLASSAQYKNQIFSYGRNALALQCHAEATPYILNSWFVGAVNDVASGAIDLEEMRADTKKHGQTLALQTEKFMLEWIDQIQKSQE